MWRPTNSSRSVLAQPVSVGPGLIVLTVMPRSITESARVGVIAAMAPLVTA
ncbi:MAG: hypothetical protein U5N21_22520 [Rhodococcus sp. (in: high G+C Gram-positive bacteria)]|nr:hypothetical protein [Rhodococcus sp. (in: high G+C Gram-positive bacteria)]